MSDLNTPYSPNDPKSAETADQKNNADMPEFAFIYFVKRYMALLATITAIPIFSTAFGLLQAPHGDKKLPVLTSMACLITFAACFQLRDSISWCVFHRRRGYHLIPFAAVFFVLLFAVGFTADYYIHDINWTDIRQNTDQPAPKDEVLIGAEKQQFRVPGVWDAVEYIIIQPLFVLALGIILVTSFTQQQNISVVALIESQFTDDDRKRLLSRVQNQIAFNRLAVQVEKQQGCSALRRAGNDIIEQCEAKMDALSQGWIVVPSREARYIMGMLFRSFHDTSQGNGFRYDAVSDRDINFWSGKEDIQLMEQYFRLNMEAISGGIEVSRVFLIADEDILNDANRSELAHVLARHHQAGIAWAVALYNELDQNTRAEAANDFALFNRNEMVASFRSHPQTDTSARFIFRTDSEKNQRVIDRQNRQYRAIVAQCWMASKAFDEVCDAYERLLLRDRKLISMPPIIAIGLTYGYLIYFHRPFPTSNLLATAIF